jgi:hypothetical protein
MSAIPSVLRQERGARPPQIVNSQVLEILKYH